jgi:hypothetical protein
MDKKSKDIPEISELPKVDYSHLPKEIEEIISNKPYIIEKKGKISFDGKQFTMRIPSEIAEEMKITKDNRILFRMIKPLPGSDEKIHLEIEII